MTNIDNTRFISFEGIDYSGKTTQIHLLAAYLKEEGYKVYVLREPGGTDISEKIRELLLDRNHYTMDNYTEIFLYSAARSQLVKEKIIPLLSESYFVIADRYVDSTTAYQGYGRRLDLKMVTEINNAATHGLLPRTTFYLQLDPEAAKQRRDKKGKKDDRLEASGIDFYRRVFQGYKNIIEAHEERFHVLNAAQPVEQIHTTIINTLKQKKIGL